MEIQRIKTLKEFHRSRRLPPPEHPLISIIDYADLRMPDENYPSSWIYGFYVISVKKNLNGKIRYGQQEYDFDEGMMFFLAPGQVLNIEAAPGESPDRSGWMLFVHPDFLWNTTLASSIKNYEYFDYAANEALFLSKKEEQTVLGIIENIKSEYSANIDKFSQNIIISHIETLLHYAERFYERQFITRKISNHQILDQLEKLLNSYFLEEKQLKDGLPTVDYISSHLNVSSGYLSNVLRSVTGKSTQQHIQDKIIEVAKEKLSTTDEPIGQIAYEIGFDYPQTFSKFFKTRTQSTPSQFRKSFEMD